MKQKSHDLLKVESYDYHLPSHLIAKEPIEPADEAKLLVYERESGRITHTVFKHLLDFIPQGCHIVFNDTRVIKARIFGKKESGGKVEVLLNKPLSQNLFNVFIKGRVKEGTRLLFDGGLEAKVLSLEPDGTRIVKFFLHGQLLDFASLLPILERIGHVPLPPYIDREDRKEDERHYQTLFAKKAGAVAAPTASLHFTPKLLQELRGRFPTHTLTLHVGAGTFKPVEASMITHHTMHSEYYEIPSATQKIIQSKEEILAVGTTVTRTIEYYARTKKPFGECDLFLHPLNPPQRVDHILTNFHLPKSTLIMLVASFVGLERTKALYQEAIERKYRFFSYGDAMLII